MIFKEVKIDIKELKNKNPRRKKNTLIKAIKVKNRPSSPSPGNRVGEKHYKNVGKINKV